MCRHLDFRCRRRNRRCIRRDVRLNNREPRLRLYERSGERPVIDLEEEVPCPDRLVLDNRTLRDVATDLLLHSYDVSVEERVLGRRMQFLFAPPRACGEVPTRREHSHHDQYDRRSPRPAPLIDAPTGTWSFMAGRISTAN